MAVRTWANALGVGAGAGLLAGAGQLGIGYGLGILRWTRDFPTGAPWHAQLAWVVFLASVAVIIGSLAGSWQARRLHLAPSAGLRVALAFAAAVGATVILPLVARPAAMSRLAETGNPRLAAIIAATVGLLIGIVIATAVLAVPPISGSVVATVLWVWIAALISAAWTLGRGASWATAELALLPAGGVWLPVTLLGPAVLIALAVAAIARFGGSDLRAVAVCGVAGPALIGLAYVIAGPGGGSQTSAYRFALFAACAGFAVSALLAVVRRRRRKPALSTAIPEPTGTRPEFAGTGSHWDPSPTDLDDLDTDDSRASRPDTGSHPDTVDYGWPEPEPDEPDTDTRRVALQAPTAPEPVDEPAAPAKKAARRRTPAKKAATRTGPTTPEAAPVSPAPVSPAPAPARPARATSSGPATAPAAAPAAEPAKGGQGRLGRRGRREPAPDTATPAKPAKAPRVSKAQAREEDHVDWVKSLGGGNGIRIGGAESGRHTDPFTDDET